LCDCGCGERVKWDKWKRKWNKFIFGHRGRVKRPSDSEAPLCNCGCQKQVKWCKHRKQWNKFISGHQSRKENNPMYGKTGAMAGRFGESHPMFGYKYTEEQLKIKSESMKGSKNHFYGKFHSSIAKAIIARSHEGMKMTIETKEKHRKFMTGRQHALGLVHTFEQRAKWSKDRKGSNNVMYGRIGPLCSAWKGGIAADPYCDVWLDKEYKKDIKDRDNNECQNPDCWKKCSHLPLTIHHIDYIKKNCDPWNLITLCTSCNSRANTNRTKWINFYQEIMSEKYGYNYNE